MRYELVMGDDNKVIKVKEISKFEDFVNVNIEGKLDEGGAGQGEGDGINSTDSTDTDQESD